MFKPKTAVDDYRAKHSDTDPNICEHLHRDEKFEIEDHYELFVGACHRIKIDGRCMGCGILFKNFQTIPLICSTKIHALETRIKELEAAKKGNNDKS